MIAVGWVYIPHPSAAPVRTHRHPPSRRSAITHASRDASANGTG